jgi:hypothetical protein
MGTNGTAASGTKRLREFYHHFLVLSLAVLLCLPCLLVGIFPGFDADTHVTYQFHFSRQFWDGDPYPRWLMEANKGYGSPIFLIQYPLPYFVTALLRPLTFFAGQGDREARELGLFLFLAFVSAGLSARFWLRKHVSPNAATAATFVYMTLPYVLGQSLYMGATIGEVCAFAWMPLCLAICDRLSRNLVAVGAMSVVIALFLMSHIHSAALFLPFLLVYASWVEGPAGSARTSRLASLALALALGLGIAAVYLVPLVAYSRLFDLGAMSAYLPGFELGRYFLFTTSGAAARAFFWPNLAVIVGLVSLGLYCLWQAGGKLAERAIMALSLGLGLAVLIPDLGPKLIRWSGIKVTGFDTPMDFSMRMLFAGLSMAALGLIAYSHLSRTATNLVRLFAITVSGVLVLTLPWSAPLWGAVPELGLLQFPYRLWAVSVIPIVGLFALALDDSMHRPKREKGAAAAGTLIVVALVVVGTGALTWRVSQRFLHPWTVTGAIDRNVDDMFRTYVAPDHLKGFTEVLGASLASTTVLPTPFEQKIRVKFIEGEGAAEIISASPRTLRISADCAENARLQIGQMYFPLWKLSSPGGGQVSNALRSTPEGLVGWPERVGFIVTMVSLFTVAGVATMGILRTRRRLLASPVKPAGPGREG